MVLRNGWTEVADQSYSYEIEFSDFIRMALNFIAKAPGNFLRFSQPRLKTFAKYAKVELTPPSPGELGQVKKENLKYKLKAEVKSYNRKIRHNP